MIAKTCEKKMKTAEIKLSKIINRIETLKLSNAYISQLDVTILKKKKLKELIYHKYSVILFAVLSVISSWWIYSNVVTRTCILEMPSSMKALFRRPEDCSMCVGVDSVERIANVSADEFEERYAYSTRPVIVTDATHDWKAIQDFNFNFFANFYRNGKMGKKINECFYFAYKSGLNSLTEVFEMDENRANLTGEPWYIGWSTCYDEETRALRTYYTRPYFLPKTAESDMIDWIFMGGPGQGAHMHLDAVRHTSWQAQVRGRKRWQLAPPPECLYRCRWLAVTVEPGDILVVDTNRWYHTTSVLPGDISITIGAEYD